MSGDPRSSPAAACGPANAGPLAAFLHTLRHHMEPLPRSTPLPERSNAAWRAVQSDADLAERFTVEATAAGCVVHRAADANWIATVAAILGGLPAKLVVVEPQPGSALTAERAAALAGTLQAAGCTATARRDDDTLFKCDAAVTGVVAAITETGTLVCTSGSAAARGATLIPPVHIALVDRTQLVGDLFDYFDRLGGTELPANVNMITGPSKTADIEGILVTGVHGPGVVHIVLLT
jgi:L-lactate dehydrogenase complex protein LldG